MPHLRARHLGPVIKQSMRFSPVVGVFGHRQVGKTTLAEGLSERYVTMDRRAQLELADRDPETLLRDQAGFPLVIDECQLAPPLFPAIKEWVRTHKAPGQLLLTGSVRFSSRKAIRESLTGRIINLELLPMDLSEAHSEKLPTAIPRLLSHKTVECELAPAPYFSSAAFRRHLELGGLPGVFAVRNEAVREERFETQIETLLERDIRLLVETSLAYRSLRNLLAALARRQTQPVDLAELSRASRISPPTLRRLIPALESMFVLRRIETIGTRRKPVFFFEDQGEASHLASGGLDPLVDMTRFLFSNLRHQWVYRPELKVEVFQFRNRGGAFVPLVLRSPQGSLGIIPILDENPDRHSVASAASFIKQIPMGKAILVHAGKEDRVLSRNLRVLPMSMLV